MNEILTPFVAVMLSEYLTVNFTTFDLPSDFDKLTQK
jgi:hypothetical protein